VGSAPDGLGGVYQFDLRVAEPELRPLASPLEQINELPLL